MEPHASILIPTHRRPDRICACLRALIAQTEPRWEALVGLDGPHPGLAQAIRDATGGDHRVRVIPCPRSGQASVRNRLIPHIRGSTVIFLNDDMRPEPGLVRAHLRAQDEARDPPALVIGEAPWVRPDPDSVFDRMIRQTSMIFFYSRMRPGDRWHDWGFRHAWMLNLSCPARLLQDLGGLTVFPCTYGYEDDEFAFRAQRRCGARVLYRPRAVAWHDHRLDPPAYLRREYRLGYAAVGFARAAPDCARALFRRDVLSDEEVHRCRRRAGEALDDLRKWFLSLAHAHSDSVRDAQIDACYERHLPLKRRAWSLGFLDALEERPMKDARACEPATAPLGA